MKTKIGIIGGGNIGSALVAGLYKHYDLCVCEQDAKRVNALKKKYKIKTGDLKKIVDHSKAIILAVKPQGLNDLLKDVRPLMTQRKLIISIAAGITCPYIEKRLGPRVRVVRTMPNLPVQVAQGMTAICPGSAAVNGDLILTCRIFARVGKTVVIEEKWMNAITAVSGSGPAYVFLFIECIQKAAESLGLDSELADELIMQTVRGSLDLLEQRKEDATVLREEVTSKGGTTQAALKVFNRNKIDKVFKTALKAANKRAKELSK